MERSVLSLFVLAVAAFWCASSFAQVQSTDGPMSRSNEVAPEPRAIPGGLELPTPLIRPPANADSLRFAVRSISVAGSTVYSDNDFSSYIATLIGRQVSLAELYDLANRLTAKYRNDGYVLSQVFVPAQTISDGEARLQVIEGYIADVFYEGRAKGRRGMLKKVADRLRASRPLHARDLERYLLLLNDLPGAIARGTLRASETVPGASDLVITLQHDILNADLFLDNHNSEYLGPLQSGVGLTFNSVLGLYESTVLNYIGASDDYDFDFSGELDYYAIAHTQRLTANGLDLTLRASTYDSVPGLGADFGNFNLETASDNASLRLDYPIRRSRTTNIYWFSRLTYHDGETSTIFFPDQSADTITAIRTGLTIDWLDSARGVNIFEIEFSKGISAFDASSIDDGGLSRPGGDPEAGTATLYAARLQSLTRGWSLLLAIKGQYAFDNVLAPEEFAFGGKLFGRGYDPSELVGDHGIAGKLELRYTAQKSNAGSLTLYGFYDIGEVHQILGPGELEPEISSSAASAGLGLRFDIGRVFSGYLEGAAPLTRVVVAEDNKDTRLFGGIRFQF